MEDGGQPPGMTAAGCDALRLRSPQSCSMRHGTFRLIRIAPGRWLLPGTVVIPTREHTKGPAMRSITLGLSATIATLAALAALAAPTFGATRANALTGTDGPGFTITMNKATVKAGTYTITIHDRSNIHDFHLTGPGVDKKTSVPAVSTTKWTVKLKKGTYHFVCDPHHTIMHGVLKVT
jgi:plastocyanin